MSLVVAIDDVKPDKAKIIDGVAIKATPNMTFFRKSLDRPISPTAYLVRHDPPGRLARAHFHIVDQFQVIVEGKGKFGRHDVAPYCVHFSRAFTPYGPLRSDPEQGWAFMTLRTRYDPGAQKFPESQGKLKQVRDRSPWQITRRVSFSAPGSGISLQDIPGIKDDLGLFACALTMAPRTRTMAPNANGGDGQYVMIVKGSLIHGNREHKALTMVFIRPDESAFEVHAGADGLAGFILNFPQVKPRVADVTTPSIARGLRKWQCALCSFAYDEALGMPEDGIAAGTRWVDVPDTWSCPDCSASKSDFQMVEVREAQ